LYPSKGYADYDVPLMRWGHHEPRVVAAKWVCIATLLLAAGARCQSFALKDGASVVMYGDSITAQRLYTRFAEDFVLTRYPQLHVQFVNAGVPGDTAFGGYAGAMLQRTQRDVQPFHPTMITVMLGMNDGGYGYTPEATVHANFLKGYDALLNSLHSVAPDAALTLINPTPYDEVTHGTEFPGYAGIMDRISEDVSSIAVKNQGEGMPVLRADPHAPMVSALTRAKRQFPELAPLLIPDRIHPGEAAHWIIAAELLKAWHIDPVVSYVVLDAKRGLVQDAQRTAVKNVMTTEGGIQWTQLDEALPLPLDLNNAMTAIMLAVSDVAQLDQEMLRVNGLGVGEYELRIDTKLVATLSREELQSGVNLALLKTPMWEQARDIDFSEERRGMLEQARFVLAEELKQTATSSAVDARLREGQDELAETVRTKLTLKPHSLDLRRK
jgi:lysophospholipase L1-like esterase